MPGDTSTGSSNSTMVMMQSVFQNARATPLYSTAWTPSSTGAYAGTCIFLILLAALMRALLAGKTYLEARWLNRELARRYVVVNGGRPPLAQRLSHDSTAKHVVLSENGVEEDVVVVGRRKTIARPWRVSVDPLRALVDMVIAGVGYLLMLAVMTMNVGYFASVLGGTFLGSLLLGRFTALPDH
ncbi:hypothetical protein CONLIGDRAFT_653663 [Coniochaeta ligniaria NRRL 30616]|uniref:Copper transport protein n=1 Tax=Coniochaeta ligniaria NRRL 30616 TaxID=1408157 RepID=A0A1J7IUM4_9PEZI|nr:hypothetical protein CONLIGDRAFT_653663 [Coniochaeta ligniaria NRRL 30616]